MAADTATGLDLTAFNSILKELYIGPIRDNLNSKTVLLHRLARNEEDVVGRIAIVPIRTGRNEGVGAIAEGGFLADPQTQGYNRAQVPTRYNYGRFLINGPTIAASRNDRGAFTTAVDSELYNLVTDLKNDVNRQIHSDGSGRLAQLSAVGGAPTYSVINPGGFTNIGNGTKFLRVGMIVAVYNEGTGAIRDSQQITAVNATAGTFTTGVALAGAAANDYVYRASRTGLSGLTGQAALSTSRFREMMGIKGIVDDADPPGGALEGIAATNTVWTAAVLGNSGSARALTLDLMQQAFEQADIRGDGKISLIVCSHALYRKYMGLIIAQKEFHGEMELDGGFKALEFNGVPFVYDKDATAGQMNFLDEEPLAIYRMSDFFWLDKDGSILRRLDDRDAYQATLALYAELGTSSRNRHAVIEDLSES